MATSERRNDVLRPVFGRSKGSGADSSEHVVIEVDFAGERAKAGTVLGTHSVHDWLEEEVRDFREFFETHLRGSSFFLDSHESRLIIVHMMQKYLGFRWFDSVFLEALRLIDENFGGPEWKMSSFMREAIKRMDETEFECLTNMRRIRGYPDHRAQFPSNERLCKEEWERMDFLYCVLVTAQHNKYGFRQARTS